MHDLTGFQRDCIRTIAKLNSPNGLEIADELEHYYESKINNGRLYPNLDELVKMSLVDKSEKDARSNEYTLTPRGKREVEFQISEWASVIPEDQDG